MGLRGPTPKPSAVRMLEGMRGHRPLNQSEPRYRDGIPDCPAGMSVAGKRIFETLVAEMAPSGVLRTVDSLALAQLAEDYAQLEELRRGRFHLIAHINREAKAKLKVKMEEFAVSGRPASEKPRLSDILPGGPAAALNQRIEGKRLDSTMRALSAQIIVQRREFGLTPASNTRIHAAGDSAGIGVALQPRQTYDPIEEAIQ